MTQSSQPSSPRMEVFVEIPYSTRWSSHSRSKSGTATKPISIASTSSTTSHQQQDTSSLRKRALSNAAVTQPQRKRPLSDAAANQSRPISLLKKALFDKPINFEPYVDIVSPKKRKAVDEGKERKSKVVKKAKIDQYFSRDENGKTKKTTVPAKVVPPEPTEAPVAPAPAEKKAAKPRAKKSVEPTWTVVEGFEEREEVEERIQLREFLQRFEPILKLAKVHYEALDEFSTFSEQTAKAILKALLDLIAADSEGNQKTSINATIKAISAAGTDLLKMWHLVQALLDEAMDVEVLTPPSSPIAHKTRTGPTHYLRPERFIDCLLALADVALRGASARAEIAEGEKDAKEKTKEWTKALKEENERWLEVRGGLMFEKPPKTTKESSKEDQANEKEYRAKYATASKEHKTNNMAINAQYFQSSFSTSSRFEPLGRDMDGRVYYVLSPSLGNRIPAKTTREGLTKWAWFVAIWGKKPSTAGKKSSEVVDDAWWGFADVEEIRKLAKWVETEATPKKDQEAIATKDAPTNKDNPSPEITSLCKGLTGFADYLEWRVGVEDQVEQVGKAAKKDAQSKEIPSKRFYAA